MPARKEKTEERNPRIVLVSQHFVDDERMEFSKMSNFAEAAQITHTSDRRHPDVELLMPPWRAGRCDRCSAQTTTTGDTTETIGRKCDP